MDGVDGGGSGGGDGGSSASDPLATVSSEGSGGGASGGGATAIPAVSTVYVTIPQAGTIVSGGSKSVSTPPSTSQPSAPVCLSLPPILSTHSHNHSSHSTSLIHINLLSSSLLPLVCLTLCCSLVLLHDVPFSPPLLPTPFSSTRPASPLVTPLLPTFPPHTYWPRAYSSASCSPPRPSLLPSLVGVPAASTRGV